MSLVYYRFISMRCCESGYKYTNSESDGDDDDDHDDEKSDGRAVPVREQGREGERKRLLMCERDGYLYTRQAAQSFETSSSSNVLEALNKDKERERERRLSK